MVSAFIVHAFRCGVFDAAFMPTHQRCVLGLPELFFGHHAMAAGRDVAQPDPDPDPDPTAIPSYHKPRQTDHLFLCHHLSVPPLHSLIHAVIHIVEQTSRNRHILGLVRHRQVDHTHLIENGIQVLHICAHLLRVWEGEEPRVLRSVLCWDRHS